MERVVLFCFLSILAYWIVFCLLCFCSQSPCFAYLLAFPRHPLKENCLQDFDNVSYPHAGSSPEQAAVGLKMLSQTSLCEGAKI